jgi:hypothetical protein
MKPEAQTEKKNRADLAGFIMMRPELRVVPIVNEDIWSEEGNLALGTLGKVEIDRIYVHNDRFYLESLHENEVVELIYDRLIDENPAWSDDYLDEMTDIEFANLDWEQVITVVVG